MTGRGSGQAFAAKGHIEIRGPDLIASVESDDAESLDALMTYSMAVAQTCQRARKTPSSHGVDIPSTCQGG